VRDGRVHGGGEPLAVFVSGDVRTGAGTVTHAIGDGRLVALLALRALGEDVVLPEALDLMKAVKSTDVRLEHFEKRRPAHEKEARPADRIRSMAREVSRGLASAAEAQRCFSCGDCTSCDTCLVYCPEGIIHRQGAAYSVDLDYCKGCGICVAECPRKAIEMVTA
jgi:2-oxoacid:acceptor oxidoreductase delta subunit (pyruvate/2-ketoisovalerate family)